MFPSPGSGTKEGVQRGASGEVQNGEHGDVSPGTRDYMCQGAEERVQTRV